MPILPIDLCGDDPRTLYEIGSIIGHGRSSTVYRATMRSTGSALAVKMIDMNGMEDTLRDVYHEVSILESTNHPRIVKYFGAYVESSTLWIVMEYCEAGTIENIFKKLNRGLREDEIACVAHHALQGLAYLHALPVLHRDVKCSNMLVTRGGELRLSDFGVSAELVSKLSQRDSFRGSISWMAPEVLREQLYDGRADIWSLGISLIEMAECSPPHITMHPMYCVMLDKEISRPGLSDPSKWSPGFLDFINACLQPSQEQRPTAEALLHHPWLQRGSHNQLKKLVNEYFHQVTMAAQDSMSSSALFPLRMTQAPGVREEAKDQLIAEPSKDVSRLHTYPFISLSGISFSALSSTAPSSPENTTGSIVSHPSETDPLKEIDSYTLKLDTMWQNCLLRTFTKQLFFSRDIERNSDKAKDAADILEGLLA